MLITFQFRLLPSKRQHRCLEQVLESQRELYNAALEERIDAYRKARVSRTFVDQSKALTVWRREDPEARSVPVTLQRATLRRVDQAYSGFFRRLRENGRAGFPRFRSRNSFHAFGFSEFVGVKFDGRSISFKGMPGCVRVHMHREMPTGVGIRSSVIRRDHKGWKIGFNVEIPESPLRNGPRAVGVDLGILSFAALSDGTVVPSIRAARRAERRMQLLQRALARKKSDSKNRHKARNRLARCHAAIRRKRQDHLNQASALLVNTWDTIAIEKLRIKPLARSVLAKDVLDASWGTFIAMLRYKAARAGVRVIEVDPRGTSQECSACKATVVKELRDRQHHCPRCGLSIDRDVNAARNILLRAGVGPGLQNVAEDGMRAGRNVSAWTS